MPRSPWETLDNLSPFARIIRDFVLGKGRWSDRMPMSVNRFAEMVGIRPATVWKWIHEGVVPEPETLDLIAAKTPIPRDMLYVASGRFPPDGGSGNTLDKLLALLEADTDLPEEARADLSKQIREHRERYGGDGRSAKDLAIPA